MHVNKWLNNAELKLSEIQIGNLFRLNPMQLSSECAITGIHLSGRIEVVNCNTKECFELESYKLLVPIKLPDAFNNSDLDTRLAKTSFIKELDGHFIMQYDKSKINIGKQLLKDRWMIWYSNDPIQIAMPIYFLHELQNVFQLITQNKLSF